MPAGVCPRGAASSTSAVRAHFCAPQSTTATPGPCSITVPGIGSLSLSVSLMASLAAATSARCLHRVLKSGLFSCCPRPASQPPLACRDVVPIKLLSSVCPASLLLTVSPSGHTCCCRPATQAMGLARGPPQPAPRAPPCCSGQPRQGGVMRPLFLGAHLSSGWKVVDVTASCAATPVIDRQC